MSEPGSAVAKKQDAADGARRTRPTWVRALSGGLVGLLVIVAGIFAFRADGTPAHDVDLADGGVWVSSGRMGYWGRINTGAHGLDLVVEGAGTTTQDEHVVRPDILQDGRNAVGVTAQRETAPRELQAIDVRTGDRIGEPTEMPTPDVATGIDFFMPDLVAMQGNTIAVIDFNTGDLWATRLDPKGGASLEGMLEEAPLVNSIGQAAAVTVSVGGDVMAVSAETGTVVELTAEGDGFGRPETTDLGFDGSRAADITAVGDDWVVTDLERGEVHAPRLDKPQPLSGGGQAAPGESLARAALQQPGPAADAVAVQTFDGARFVPISGSTGGEEAREITSGLSEDDDHADRIQLSRPLINGDCLYAAWGDSSAITWGGICEEGSTPTTTLLAAGDLERSTGVAVRHNRGQILLNDLDTGRVFDLSLGGRIRIDTWPDGAPRAEPRRWTPDHITPSSSASSTKGTKKSPKTAPSPKSTG